MFYGHKLSQRQGQGRACLRLLCCRRHHVGMNLVSHLGLLPTQPWWSGRGGRQAHFPHDLHLSKSPPALSIQLCPCALRMRRRQPATGTCPWLLTCFIGLGWLEGWRRASAQAAEEAGPGGKRCWAGCAGNLFGMQCHRKCALHFAGLLPTQSWWADREGGKLTSCMNLHLPRSPSARFVHLRSCRRCLRWRLPATCTLCLLWLLEIVERVC